MPYSLIINHKQTNNQAYIHKPQKNSFNWLLSISLLRSKGLFKSLKIQHLKLLTSHLNLRRRYIIWWGTNEVSFFFFIWIIFKVIIFLLHYCFCSMFWFGFLVVRHLGSQPDERSNPHALHCLNHQTAREVPEVSSHSLCQCDPLRMFPRYLQSFLKYGEAAGQHNLNNT